MEIPLRFAGNFGADFPRNAVDGAVVVPTTGIIEPALGTSASTIVSTPNTVPLRLLPRGQRDL